MSITRLQQARQMYAMGQRVAKTLDGSRPGYRGDDAARSSEGTSAGRADPGAGACFAGTSLRQSKLIAPSTSCLFIYDALYCLPFLALLP